MIQLYLWSRQFNDALPDAGGIRDQIAIVMEALSIVHSEYGKMQAWKRFEEQVEMERENAKKSRSSNRSKGR